MKFTSDVSLPKDDKTTMQGKQISAGQLKGIQAQINANYATIKLEAQSCGHYTKTSRPFIDEHLLTNHPP